MKTIIFSETERFMKGHFWQGKLAEQEKCLSVKQSETEREPCTVILPCQYSNDFHGLPTEERVGYLPLMWSCTPSSFHDSVKYSSYWILTEQGHKAFSGLPGTQADLGRRHTGWLRVQLRPVLKDDSKRGRKFKSSLKYSKVMRCPHKILS